MWTIIIGALAFLLGATGLTQDTGAPKWVVASVAIIGALLVLTGWVKKPPASS